MEFCFRCQKNENQVRLLDAIYGNEIVKICEECSSMENIPIIRRPNSFQLQESERPYSVRERLSRMAGVPLKREIKKEDVKPKLNLDNLRKPRDYAEIIAKRQERAKKANQPLNLVDNYNWHIQMARRNRKLTLGQVGEVIGESESVLKMIEEGLLPDDSNRIIGKLEQYFQMSLRKSDSEKEAERIEAVKQPARILSFDKAKMDSLTIHDLKIMREARKMAEKEASEDKGENSFETDKKGMVGKDIEFFED